MTDRSTQARVKTTMFSIVAAWACQKRGKCCGSWQIHVPPSQLRDMALKCAEKGEAEDALLLMAAHLPERRQGAACVMPTRQGMCMFLEDNLCGYRMRHGAETLPVSCKKFPYVAIRTPERIIMGLSFACPTALDMLARGGGELIDDFRGQPPSMPVFDFRGDEPATPDSPAVQFWDTHWSWFEVFCSLQGRPQERLHELGKRASGCDPPEVAVDERFWNTPDPELAKPLVDNGALMSVLTVLFNDRPPRCEPEDILDDPEDDVLLNHYLNHRLLVPEFLSRRASLVRLLGMLFAAVARFRIDRAHGKRAMHAILHLDRLILHSDLVDDLFACSEDEMAVCATLWLAANATSRPTATVIDPDGPTAPRAPESVSTHAPTAESS